MREICCCQVGGCEPAPTSFSQDRASSILLVWEEAIQTKQLHSTCRKHLIASILCLRAAAPAELLLACWMQPCSPPTEGENRSKFTLKWVVWYATLFCLSVLLHHDNRKVLYCINSGTESSHWCKWDKSTWKLHLNKTAIWSRTSNPYQTTPEFHSQKFGEPATSIREERNLAEMLFQLTNSEMLQAAKKEHYQMFVGIPFFYWQVLQRHFNAIQFCIHFA